MTKSDEKMFNDALKRALSTPPKPHKPLGKKKGPTKKKGANSKVSRQPKR